MGEKFGEGNFKTMQTSQQWLLLGSHADAVQTWFCDTPYQQQPGVRQNAITNLVFCFIVWHWETVGDLNWLSNDCSEKSPNNTILSITSPHKMIQDREVNGWKHLQDRACSTQEEARHLCTCWFSLIRGLFRLAMATVISAQETLYKLIVRCAWLALLTLANYELMDMRA